jgi:hypothetical protein
MKREELSGKTMLLKRTVRKKVGETYAHVKYIFDKNEDNPEMDFVCMVPVKLGQKLMKKGIYVPFVGIIEAPKKEKVEKIIPASYSKKNKSKIKSIKEESK